MSQQQSSSSQYQSGAGSSQQSPGDRSSPSQSDDWSHITDPGERRKIQNKLAQRKFRKKQKEQREDDAREQENQRRAGSAYATAEAGELDSGTNLSGLPWGGMSMKHIVETGKTKEQHSQQSSRENSVYAAASRTGGSSRVGLHLSDRFARGYPAWRYFPYRHPGFGDKHWRGGKL